MANEKAASMGHIAVVSLCGSLSIFFGIWGLLAGVALFILWAVYSEKK